MENNQAAIMSELRVVLVVLHFVSVDLYIYELTCLMSSRLSG